MQVTELILCESDEDRKKKQELTELKDELRTISMVDEFPRYARTERKINKLTADLNTAGLCIHFKLLKPKRLFL